MLASAADYLGWSGQRNYYRTTYQTFFREWDVLLTPANIVNAFPHTDLPFYRRKLNVNGRDVAYSLQNVYPGLATLCGLPATVFPVGLTRSGLPVGLQVIGPYLEDRTTLRFVALVAREIGAFQPLPGLDPGPRYAEKGQSH
jgi:amidase